eukprot:TRINITY_DN9905_c0_g3_i1.p1 TRINITY_DN9905_c0_g3~~TRINITY_DN9905_c0_g3_i1.p1  ORF type:complete len:271 (-),score=77.17 TRINITY_DN9905_c0_g3_i1:22-834(-)
MSWLNNNKKNARFDPNRRDDRLLAAEVTARRVHKARKKEEPEEELVSTDSDQVLSMSGEARVDWLQTAIMQVATSKLKADPVYDIMKNPKFSPRESKFRKQLKATFLANGHIFSAVQRKALDKIVGSWDGETTAAEKTREKSRGRGKAHRSTSSSPSRRKSKKQRKKSSSSQRSGSESFEVAEEELLSTDLEHVLSMDEETRVDWFQVGLLQVPGKLQATALYEVVKDGKFPPAKSEVREKLAKVVTSNLHHFSEKQKKALEKMVSGWGS